MNNLEIIAHTIGTALRKLRKQAGYNSYEQFAFDHKISRIQYWKMENGNNFTLKSLLKVLDAHEIKISDFLYSLKDLTENETEDSTRLKKIIAYSKQSKKDFSKYLGYKNLNNLNHVLLGRNSISLTLAKKITSKFPEICLDWILKGEGSFLQSTYKSK